MKCCDGWCGAGVGVGAAARLAATVMAVFVAGAVVVHAAPVTWRNGSDGTFQWRSKCVCDQLCDDYDPSMFDITSPPRQRVRNAAVSLYRTWCPAVTSGSSELTGIGPAVPCGGGGSPCAVEIVVPEQESVWNSCLGISYRPVRPIGFGEVVDATDHWRTPGQQTLVQKRICGGEVYRFPGPFVGMRVRLGGRWHYGWVRWRREIPAQVGGSLAAPVAWGLESQPDTPIVTPPCDADHDLNGQVDFADYEGFMDDFANERVSADFNMDFYVDFFDYLDFVEQYASGCGV